MRFPRRYIQSLNPYTCLILLAVPLAVVEPLKWAAVFICGSGHWVTGSIVIVCAYAVSVFLVERLFKIVKPKLLALPWFNAHWSWYVKARKKAFNSLRTIWNGKRKSAAKRTGSNKKAVPEPSFQFFLWTTGIMLLLVITAAAYFSLRT